MCIEDALNVGWFMPKGSAVLPEESVPLCWAYEFDRPPLGIAVDFRREVDGEITAFLSFFDAARAEDARVLFEAGDIEASVFANEITEEKHDDVREILSFRIRSVNLIAVASWPKVVNHVNG